MRKVIIGNVIIIGWFVLWLSIGHSILRTTTMLLQEYVLTDEQNCQYPHGEGDFLELACQSMTKHIGDDADEDAIADAVSLWDGDKG